MKILSINTRNYLYNQKDSSQVTLNNNKTYSKQIDKNISSFDTVCFKQRTDEKFNAENIFINDMREIEDLPCACCGVKMFKNSTVNEFLNDKVYYPAYISLQRIKREEGFDEEKESFEVQEAYDYLCDYAFKHKDYTMNDIIGKQEIKDARKKMPMEVSEAFEYINEMTKLIAHNSRYIMDEMEKLNPQFKEPEKMIYEELQELSYKYPNKTFFDILNTPRIHEKHLSALKKKQMDALKDVYNLTPELKDESAQKLHENLKEAKKIFNEESAEITHKRGRVIKSFNNIIDNLDEGGQKKKELKKAIEKLPDSKTDLDAFMIKSSQKNSNAMIETLVGRIRNTFEHVKPHHRENDNGKSNISNYICLCGKCNEKRKRTPYKIFLNTNKEMVHNSQRQINKIIYYINQGLLKGHDFYPNTIKKALGTESGNKIIIDITKLNTDMAKANRDIRLLEYKAQKKIENKTPKIFKFGTGLVDRKQTKR